MMDLLRFYQYIIFIGLLVGCQSIQNVNGNYSEENLSNLERNFLQATSTITVISTPTKKEIASKVYPTLEKFIPPTVQPSCGQIYLNTQSIENTDKLLLFGIAILCTRVDSTGFGFHNIPTNEGYIDLDAGIIGNSLDADIVYTISGGSMLFYDFEDVNESQSVSWGYHYLKGYPSKPSFEQCASMIDIFDTDNEPKFLCVITSNGNLSRIIVEEYKPLGEEGFSIKISFITWSYP